MCKLDKINIGIKKLDFTSYKGKMAAFLSDGREVIVPLSFFSDLMKLS